MPRRAVAQRPSLQPHRWSFIEEAACRRLFCTYFFFGTQRLPKQGAPFCTHEHVADNRAAPPFDVKSRHGGSQSGT